jgi:hypothetical protein
MNYNFFIYFIIITISFLIYVEFNVGNLMYRTNEFGEKSFQVINCIHYLMNPLLNSVLWNWYLLDVNYIFVMFCSIIIYMLCKK